MTTRIEDRERTEEPIVLDAVEAAIRGSNQIEEWHRDMLLAEVRSLKDFYLTRVGPEASAMTSR